MRRFFGVLAIFAVLAGAVPAIADSAAAVLTAERLKTFDALNTANDWAELEKQAGAALAELDRTPGADDLDRATALLWLQRAHEGEGRYALAEGEARRLLAIREAKLGPDAADTGDADDAVAGVLYDQGQLAQAEMFYRRGVAVALKNFAPDSLQVAVELSNLALVVQDRGRLAEAEPLYRRALAAARKTAGDNSPYTATFENNLAEILRRLGRYEEAELLFRESLAVSEATLGQNHPATASSLNNLAHVLQHQGRYAEAEPLFTRAIAIDEAASGPDHASTAIDVHNKAALLSDLGRMAEAEALMRRALAIQTKAQGAAHPNTARMSADLAELLRRRDRPAEAEALYREAEGVQLSQLGPRHPDLARTLGGLAEVRQARGDLREADRLARQALRINQSTLGAAHPLTLAAEERLADIQFAAGDAAGAAARLRPVCAARLSTVSGRGQNGDTHRQGDSLAGHCARRLTLALRALSPRPDGRLAREAFIVAQRATQSAAAEALARAGALDAARRDGVGAEAQAYEDALVRRDSLDQALAEVAGKPGPAAADRRETLRKDRAAAGELIASLERTLILKAPGYWDFRAPGVVPVAELQGRARGRAGLLNPDEALILFETPADGDRGLVFAVTRENFAWATINLTGRDLAARIAALRRQIDPLSYGVAEPPGAGSAPRRRGPRFDRQAAFDLYKTLFGDPAIQAVIGSKPTWLVIPSGALTTLPPALLVTAPPPGGTAGDASPEQMRVTAWLARSRAIGILPAVGSLRTLRTGGTASAPAGGEALLALADPDFGGGAGAGDQAEQAAPRGFDAYFRDGRPNETALSRLPALPGARAEAQALKRALGAADDTVLSGAAASKAELLRRNRDGRLAKVRVLEFATHGLLAGDISGLAEPALALSAEDGPGNILLRASEAAGLTLHADWVLLSACNTASPDAADSQGLSGLTRAFLFAGARSLLVSHWRLSDDVAETLVPAILRLQRGEGHLSKAEALRRASLAILDDGEPRHAFPFAWAPFVLVGEPR